jgi:hypothetical protein
MPNQRFQPTRQSRAADACHWATMNILVALVALVAAAPQSSYGCSCISDGKPPSAREIRSDMGQLLAGSENVLRVRAASKPADATYVLNFVVVSSWKGKYKRGDIVVVRSGPTICTDSVMVGEELLVGFDDIEHANFAPESAQTLSGRQEGDWKTNICERCRLSTGRAHSESAQEIAGRDARNARA